jgi:hypothetical protein
MGSSLFSVEYKVEYEGTWHAGRFSLSSTTVEERAGKRRLVIKTFCCIA